MQAIQRKFSGEADKRAMEALVQAFPTDNLHVTDLPYRLSSWALDHVENIGLWVNPHGQLVAWAVMQTPFWAIDYACHPQAGSDLHRQVLAWADRRAAQVLGTPSGRPWWYVNVLAGQADRIRDLEAAGFACQANVGDDSWSQVLMQRPAQTPVMEGRPLPPGFAIRPLAGESEIQAYVELHRTAFESRNMTAEWRTRALRHPAYIPDLDLVAVAPDGSLAAFCICWLGKNEGISGQIEPLGVHPSWRRLGLGRAILAEGLRRLHLHGATQVYVETDNYRNAAFCLYESAGFRVIEHVLVYRRDYETA